MFMLSFRLTKKKVLLGVLAVVLVATLGVVGVNRAMGRSVETSTIQTSSKAKKVTAKTNEQRIAFAQGFGWEVEEEPAEILEVIIPKEFDEVYEQYNSIQKQMGYDLTKFAGKRCKRYSYTVTNYPQATGEVRFNLLVCDNKIIGGDVCSLDVNGFMHGFALQ